MAEGEVIYVGPKVAETDKVDLVMYVLQNLREKLAQRYHPDILLTHQCVGVDIKPSEDGNSVEFVFNFEPIKQ